MAEDTVTATTETKTAGTTTETATAETTTKAAETATTTAATTTAAPSWRDTITDVELKKVAERFTSPADAVKAVSDLRKRESTSLRIPGADAKPEEIAAYREKLGVPADVKGYAEAFSKPAHLEEAIFNSEPMKAVLGKFASDALAAGLSKAQMKDVMSSYWAIEAQAMQQTVAADKQFATETEAALRKEWPGTEYDKNKAIANKAAAQFFGTTFEEARQIETKSGRFLLDHPLMVKAFAVIGREMGEDKLGPELSADEKQSAQNKMDDLSRQKHEAYRKGDRSLANRLDKEERALIEKTRGNAPIIGSQGRAA